MEGFSNQTRSSRSEPIYVREFPDYLDLKILAWLGDLNTVVLRKALKKMNTPMQQPIPGFPLLIFKRCIVERPPFPMKHRATIVFAKIRPQVLFQSGGRRSLRPVFLSRASRPGSDDVSCADSVGAGRFACN